MAKRLTLKTTSILVLMIFILPMVLLMVPSAIPSASAAGLIIPTTGYTAACAVAPYTTIANMSMGAGNAIDGLVTDATRWAYSSADGPYAANSTVTKYVTYDFGSAKTFNTVSFWIDRLGTYTLTNTTAFSLQYGDAIDPTLTGQTPTAMTISTSSTNDITDGSQTIKKYTTPRLATNITARYVRFCFKYKAANAQQSGMPSPVEINLSYDFNTVIPTTAYTAPCAVEPYTSITGIASSLLPDKSIDGTITYNSRWAYNGSSWTNGQVATKYVTYDLGTSKTFNEFTFHKINQPEFTLNNCTIQSGETIDGALNDTATTLTMNTNPGDQIYGTSSYRIYSYTTPKFTDKAGRYVRIGFNYTSVGAASKSPAMPIEIFLGNSLSVNYDANGSTGGTVPTDNKKYFSSNNATVLGNTGTLEKPGYAFAGWNTAADGSGTDYAADATFAIDSSTVTLYAQWTEVDYSLTENLIIKLPVKSGNTVTVNVENTTGSNTNGVIIIGNFETTGNKNMNAVVTKSIVIKPGVNTYTIDVSAFSGYTGATTKVFILNSLTLLNPYCWNTEL